MNQPMNKEFDATAAATDEATQQYGDATSALQQNRDVLRQRLAERKHEKHGLDGVSDFVEIAAPLTRRLVRKHPYAALTGAAVIGALLARGSVWRALGSSLLAGAVAREVVKLSLSSGRTWLEKLNARLDEAAEKVEDVPPP